MRAGLFATSAFVLLCAMPAAYAQDAGPRNDSSIHQSAGDRDSRGTPKYYHSRRGERGEYRQGREYRRDYGYEGRGRSDDYMQGRSTTGAGPSYDRGGGPFYDNSIHQSAGDRDSRGTPKYNQDY